MAKPKLQFHLQHLTRAVSIPVKSMKDAIDKAGFEIATNGGTTDAFLITCNDGRRWTMSRDFKATPVLDNEDGGKYVGYIGYHHSGGWKTYITSVEQGNPCCSSIARGLFESLSDKFRPEDGYYVDLYRRNLELVARTPFIKSRDRQ